MNDKLWIEIETNKRPDHVMDGPKLPRAYRGSIDEKIFQSVLDEPESRRFIKLDNVYWIDAARWVYGDLMVSPVRLGRDGIYQHFRGALYLRVCDIATIAPLDGNEDREWMDSEAKARLQERAGEKHWVKSGNCSPLPHGWRPATPLVTDQQTSEAYENCHVCSAPIYTGDTAVCIQRNLESRNADDEITVLDSDEMAFLCTPCGQRFPLDAIHLSFGERGEDPR